MFPILSFLCIVLLINALPAFGKNCTAVLLENASRLIFLAYFGEVINLEFPLILASEGKLQA
jgi:hypothetical protein